jgi:hypothetical protein
MIRVVIENIVLFLLPTALYVLYVLVMRSGDDAKAKPIDEAPLMWLFIAGAALVIGTLLLFGSTEGGKPGQHYTPPIYKDGHIEPGKVE